MVKRHVASCSFGKDSMATVLLALEHDEPLDEVAYCEVMFDEHTSGEVPEHREFVYTVAIPFLKKAGIRVNVVRGEKTFVGQFQHTVGSGDHAGQIWSWPLCGKCYVQRDLKVRPMDAWKRKNWKDDEIIQYVGIADDEMDRLARMDSYKYQTISLLEKYKIPEARALEICRAHGLLSPVYEFAPRNGCFFCPNAKNRELRHLYDHHPDLWARLMELQRLPNKTTERFTRELRFDEIDAMFRMDDAQFDMFSEKKVIPFDEGGKQ